MQLQRPCNFIQFTRRTFSSSKTKAIAASNIAKINSDLGTDATNPFTHFVFGANTDVGKSVLTAALLGASIKGNGSSCSTGGSAHYIKPLQCGGSDESFMKKYVSNLSSSKTLFEWDTPASPHFAARLEDKPVDDEQVLAALEKCLDELESSSVEDFSASNRSHENQTECYGTRSSIWIETAGGVLSPSSSSPKNCASHHARNCARDWGWITQADLYTSFRDRSSVVLIGDGRLGGISSTLTALEALLTRKYTVGGILLIQDAKDRLSSYDPNLEALREYTSSYPSSPSGDGNSSSNGGLFANPEKSIVSVPPLPPEPEPLNDWFASSDVQDQMHSFVHGLFDAYDTDRSFE